MLPMPTISKSTGRRTGPAAPVPGAGARGS